jgi:hypothetical protein
MIKIIRAIYLKDRTIRLEFSDSTTGDYDLHPLVACATEMVKPLEDGVFFQQFFLEIGALCWPNGFDLSGSGIQQRLREQGALRALAQVD